MQSLKLLFTHLLVLLSMTLAFGQTPNQAIRLPSDIKTQLKSIRNLSNEPKRGQDQAFECGTASSMDPNFSSEEFLKFKEEFEAKRKANALMLVEVPIQAHVVRTSNGAGGVDLNAIDAGIIAANAAFEPLNVRFVPCGPISVIDNSDYYNFRIDSDETSMHANHGKDDVINIYFVNEVVNTSGQRIGGYATFPWLLPRDLVVVDYNQFDLPTLMVHELGHYFGLLHTHETADGIEYVSGSNCQVAGDLLCDTPADPNLAVYSNTVGSNCFYVGDLRDPQGDLYSPDVRNFMSYAPRECRNLFTPDQYARMANYYNNGRTYLICNEINNQPDLTYNPSNISVSVNETNVQISVEVQNIGTASSASCKLIYLVLDTLQSPWEFFKIDSIDVASIAPNSSRTFTSGSIDIRNIISEPGSYFPGFWIDYYDVISEIAENNNAAYWPGVPINVEGTSPSLSCNGITIDDNNSGASSGDGDGIAEPGEAIEIDLNLANTGNGNATNVRAILSSSSPYVTINDDDINFGTIATGQNKTGANFDFEISQNAPGGSTLTFDVAISANEGNWNCSFDIELGEADLPDLAYGTDREASVNGTNVQITADVDNVGGVSSSECKLMYVMLEIVGDQFIEFPFDSTTIGPIAPGSSRNYTSRNVDVSSVISKPGTYYPAFKIDWDNDVIEASESNNALYFEGFPVEIVAVTPSLSCNGITIDDNNSGASSGDGDGIAEPGEAIEIDLNLANTGNGDATNVRATLSTSSPYVTINDDDISFGTIAAGQNKTRANFDFEISQNAPGGSTLTFDVAISANEGNWNCSFDIELGEADLPDLVSRSFFLIEGESELDMQVGVENIGSADAGSSTVEFFASSNTTISSSDVSLGSQNVGALGPGEDISLNFSVDLCTVSGLSENVDYYIGFIIDVNEVVDESDENNNTERFSGQSSFNCAVEPIANFTASATNICTNSQILYTNQSQGASSYSWSFPGGTPSTSTEPNPVVSYFNLGTYAVSLVASGPGGEDTETKVNYITVNVLPNVSLSSFQSICINESPFTLTGGTPLGGNYAGPGVSNGLFSPVIAGLGTHTISYAYQATGGCSDTAFQTIEVLPEGNCTEPPFQWTPTNLSALIYGQAQIEGIPASDGDWIAAFDEDGNCAGADPIVISGGLGYITLVIYGDVSTTQGMDEGIGNGEKFSLQLYDASEDEYLNYPNSSNISSFSGWTSTNGTPLPGFDNINSIYNFTKTASDVIPLNPGWNLISIDVSPVDHAVGQVFSSLSSLNYVTGFEGGSVFYDPTQPSFLNSLSQVKDGNGYYVNVASRDTLVVQGAPIDPGYQKDLDEGWNLVAYLPATSASPADHFASLIASNKLQYVTGFEGGSVFFDPNGLPFLNSLTSLKNGYGYWLRMNEAVNGRQHRFRKGIKPSPHYLFVNATSNLPNSAVGQEVEVINEASGTVAHMRVLPDGYLMTTPVYGDDPFTPEADGVAVGEQLHFRFKHLIADPGLKYQEGQQVHHLHLEFQPAIAFEVSPNPFEGNISVRYRQYEEAEVHFVLRDVLGREVAQMLLDRTKGSQGFEWILNDLADGLYIMSMEVDGKVIEMKRVIHQR